MSEPVYEMNWDCEYCDAKGLLGLTHRYCPHCGAPQNPGRRYFPPEDKRVAVQDHVYAGKDKVCGACSAPNGAKADFCGTCGNPLDQAGEVKLVERGTSLKERAFTGTSAPPPPAPSRTWMYIAGAIFGFALVCCGLMFWTSDADAVVTAHQWVRVVEVQEFKTVEEGDWRSSVPAEARAQRCHEKQKGTRKEPDGETCTTSSKDNGDGTFKQVKNCTPKYRDVPEMGTWCDYTIDKWVTVRNETAGGDRNDQARAWPEPKVSGCNQLGCTRVGPKKEHLKLEVQVPGKEVTTCEDVPEPVWVGAADGAAVKVAVDLLGNVRCGDIELE